MKAKNKFFQVGPATLVAAAFIGPGTVTVCTLAGVNHGYDLLWALLFSIFTTIVLQEMAARLGLVYKSGLGEALRSQLQNPIIKLVSIILVLSAILVGNAAYEAGNISGAILGVETFIDTGNAFLFPGIIAIIAFILLYLGSYKILEKVLVTLVVIMSICFVVTALLTRPSISGIVSGLFTPRISSTNILTIIGLIGTTVVPYNLFLHASLIHKKWPNPDLKTIRKDTIISIVLGGIVSMAIVICASALKGSTISSAADLGMGLKPLLGEYSSIAISVGLFAAGITSAITAPLAAAYATSGILGWSKDEKSMRFRLVWITILGIGFGMSSLGIKPIEIIRFAQIANGLLLPLIAGFLLWVVNKKEVMGDARNSLWQNISGIIILMIVLAISYRILF